MRPLAGGVGGLVEAAAIPARRGAAGSDLFTQLCNITGENGDRFTDDEIIDHTIFIMVAAHDTTASALTTLVWHLLGAPAWQARLADEADALGTETLDLPIRLIPRGGGLGGGVLGVAL